MIFTFYIVISSCDYQVYKIYKVYLANGCCSFRATVVEVSNNDAECIVRSIGPDEARSIRSRGSDDESGSRDRRSDVTDKSRLSSALWLTDFNFVAHFDHLGIVERRTQEERTKTELGESIKCSYYLQLPSALKLSSASL